MFRDRFHRLRLVAAALAALIGAFSAVAADPGVVRVGVYQNEPKLLAGANGQPSGILGDLLVEIAQREGWRLESRACQWQQCLEWLKAGEIDLLPDVAFTPERAEYLDYHRHPALHSWSALYGKSTAGIGSMLDLEGRRLAVLQGSIQQSFLQNLLQSFGVEATLVPVASLTEGFEKTASGRVDAVVANRHFGDYRSAHYGLTGLPVMFQPARLFYATGKGRNGAVLAALDAYLEEWADQPDSPYVRILRQWGEPAPGNRVPRGLWWGLGGLMLLSLAAIAGLALLRWKVAERTAELADSEARLATILNSVEANIYIKGRDLRYQYGNRLACESLGCTPEALQGQGDAAFFPDDVVEVLQAMDREVLSSGERVVREERLPATDGGPERIYLSVKIPLRDSSGDINAICGISTNITEHRRNLEEIHQLAFYDPLTNLPNRRLLLDRLEHALANRERNRQNGALLFIDLDNFKSLNDTLGHDMGDRLLQQVSERLRTHIREADTLARLGGDEFVLMLEGLDSQPEKAVHQVEVLATKLLQLLAEPYSLPRHTYSSSASLGVAMFSDGYASVDELLKRADLAMYEAKTAGRNRVRFFNPKMQAEVNDRAAMETDLREGLRQGQFFLVYQPLVDAAGALVGAEALVRWLHPERGVVSPADFIPVAEANGQILPLGRWILRSACRQLVAWADAPESAHLKLAVNISASQFHHPGFVDDVLGVIDETGADPDRLELELTESQLVEDVETMIAHMQRLKRRGVRFSLDDFGTGYSSLSYLKRLPLDHLKIDQSFVRDLLTDPNDEAIVRTVIALGRSLDLAVIAEGVETLSQWRRLLELGCDQFQGYLFGRPGPVEVLLQPGTARPVQSSA